MTTSVISIQNPSEEDIINFTSVMDQYQEVTAKEMEELAKELDISLRCASDVQYLRTRYRHTPELEAELIRLHKEGNPPNISEFGVTQETQANLMKAIGL